MPRIPAESVSRLEGVRVLVLANTAEDLAEMLYDAWDTLAFYASEKTWDHMTAHGTVTTRTLATQDGGARARKALS
jgi:hypothetical protein